MKTYQKKIIHILLAFVCLVTLFPNATFANTQPTIQTSTLNMKVGDQITISVQNLTNKITWSATNTQSVNLDTKDALNVKVTAKKAGKTVIIANHNNFVLRYEIKITKHALQKKKLSVWVDGEPKIDKAGFDLHWKPLASVQGYCIYRKENNKMKKIKTIRNRKTSSLECSDKYSHSSYYIRAYVKKNGITIYSPYANATIIAE